MGITASISILSLGRPEVLRSLRHYQWGQSQGHHTIEHLERGTERGSVWQPFLKGWDRAIVNQVNIVSWKMWSTEELETLPMGTKPRPPHHRSPGKRHGKRKCLTTFLERMRQRHCQSGEHCLLEDVKYWGAWDITSGDKAKATTPSITWKEARKEEVFDNLPWKDETEALSIRWTLSLGRCEVLRSLRHYQWGQSQGHHTIDHLDRWAERGSVWWPSLKGRERAIVNQVNTGTISKQQRQCGGNFWKVGQSSSERREYHLGMNGTEDEGSNPGLCSNPLLPLLTSGVVNRCLVLQTRARKKEEECPKH